MLIGFACVAACAADAYAQRPPSATAQRNAARAALRASIDSAVKRSEFRSAHWGVLIVDAERGDTLYSRNAEKLVVPASNQKIITAATAIAELGAQFRFTTRVAAVGSVSDSTLAGDLIVIGSGDPSFSDKVRGDAAAGLRDMADSVRAYGIARVEGRLKRAAGLFPDSPFGFGWAVDDLGEAYAAAVGELMYNDSFSAARVTLEGTPAPPLSQPTGFRNFLEAFNAVLYDRGVFVRGSYDWMNPVVDTGLGTLFTYESPPLRELLPHFMKPSQNQIGELLLKTMGRQRTGVGSADSGAAVVTRRLRQWGVDSSGFVVRDGSGLSRHDFVSPEAIVRVLSVMRRDSSFVDFYNSFPIAGVDGTLDKRFLNTPAQNNAHAKTGSMDRVRTLSGYITTADGRTLIFSIMVNAYATPGLTVEAAIDSIVVRLANFRSTTN
ncbi:MAG TPA: D-alanyl-D-alanine carboxypeptidase/D-alanyl-D-alanine-endopeptidase [Gemmatimonadaceae bacterium]|nr:D-alanyl-D-alanine carboxypeptidase/D-alanyl-D-alanine-endopeptidase [Gemmatimonadaceae bacterium]